VAAPPHLGSSIREPGVSPAPLPQAAAGDARESSRSRVNVWQKGIMQRSGTSILLVLVLARTAAAQTAAPEPAAGSAQGLEAEVGDALAARGVTLSRHNLKLRLQVDGARLTASLVEAGGHIAASTRVDPLPDDPAAAVAAATQAVVDLDSQVGQRVNEFKFQLMAMRFAPSYSPDARLEGATRQWQVFRGRRTQELESPEFYQMVGRDDLASAYTRRRYLMYGAFITGGVAFGTAAALTVINESDYEPCNMIEGPGGLTCVNQHHRSIAPVLIALGVGIVGVGVGTYLYRSPQPIDENDAKALADAYNRQLRGKLGLAAVADRPRLRDVTIAPYAGGAASGVTVAARF
jgi:hypothetical protein